MASIKRTATGTYQVCFQNKLLPKRLWMTFDTFEQADAYTKQLEALLAQGIVPASLLERSKAKQELWTVHRCIVEYQRNNPVPVSAGWQDVRAPRCAGLLIRPEHRCARSDML
jgi:hypothetical protein